MKLIFSLALVSACSLASAQDKNNDFAAHALAIKSQNTLNAVSERVVLPAAMKSDQTLKSVQATLEARAREWPVVESGPDPWDRYRSCQEGLDRASYVASLANMKANSSLDDKVFDLEKLKLQRLRSKCEAVIRRGAGAL